MYNDDKENMINSVLYYLIFLLLAQFYELI